MLSRTRAALMLVCALAGAVSCHDDPVTAAAPPGDAPVVEDTTATPASHGKVPPDYGVVFPQDSVNTIAIAMTAAQWASIRADMQSLYGFSFGAGGAASLAVPEEDPQYVGVTVVFNGKEWRHAGFRLKGNSTLSRAWREGIYKLPFRLNLDEFEDDFPEIKGQRFYGFKELSMSPGGADYSLTREKITADVFRDAGVPAARTAFYRVFIDFGEGPKYCGVYTMVEVIDDTMIKDQFGEDDGNIYKPVSRFLSFTADQFERKNHKSSTDYSDVQAAITALNSSLRTSTAAAWHANLEAAFNVDHFIHWLAVSNAIVNWDSYGTSSRNYYLYNHSAKRLTWVPWDHNEAMSGSPGAVATGSTTANGLSLAMNEVNAGWPLIRFIADDPVYLAKYKSYLAEFRGGVFSQSAMNARFDKYHALIMPFVVGPGGEQPHYTYLPSGASFTAALAELKAHVLQRHSVLGAYLP